MVVIVSRKRSSSLLLSVQISANNRGIGENVGSAATQDKGVVVTIDAARVDSPQFNFGTSLEIGIGVRWSWKRRLRSVRDVRVSLRIFAGPATRADQEKQTDHKHP